MHWETKKIYVTLFIAIFASLWWFRTEPTISLRCACKCQWNAYVHGQSFTKFGVSHLIGVGDNCGWVIALRNHQVYYLRSVS